MAMAALKQSAPEVHDMLDMEVDDISEEVLDEESKSSDDTVLIEDKSNEKTDKNSELSDERVLIEDKNDEITDDNSDMSENEFLMFELDDDDSDDNDDQNSSCDVTCVEVDLNQVAKNLKKLFAVKTDNVVIDKASKHGRKSNGISEDHRAEQNGIMECRVVLERLTSEVLDRFDIKSKCEKTASLKRNCEKPKCSDTRGNEKALETRYTFKTTKPLLTEEEMEVMKTKIGNAARQLLSVNNMMKVKEKSIKVHADKLLEKENIDSRNIKQSSSSEDKMNKGEGKKATNSRTKKRKMTANVENIYDSDNENSKNSETGLIQAKKKKRKTNVSVNGETKLSKSEIKNVEEVKKKKKSKKQERKIEENDKLDNTEEEVIQVEKRKNRKGLASIGKTAILETKHQEVNDKVETEKNKKQEKKSKKNDKSGMCTDKKVKESGAMRCRGAWVWLRNKDMKQYSGNKQTTMASLPLDETGELCKNDAEDAESDVSEAFQGQQDAASDSEHEIGEVGFDMLEDKMSETTEKCNTTTERKKDEDKMFDDSDDENDTGFSIDDMLESLERGDFGTNKKRESNENGKPDDSENKCENSDKSELGNMERTCESRDKSVRGDCEEKSKMDKNESDKNEGKIKKNMKIKMNFPPFKSRPDSSKIKCDNGVKSESENSEDEIDVGEALEEFGAVDESDDTDIEEEKEGEMYLCVVCLSKFSSVEELEDHTKVFHSDVNMLEIKTCTLCGYKLAGTEELVIHLASHMVDKPYPCPQCSQRFLKYETVLQHFKKKHPDNDIVLEIPELCLVPYLYQCDVCNRKYTNKKKLVDHFEDHIKYRQDAIKGEVILYKCCLCDYHFPERSDVIEHMQSHEDTHKFSCNICLHSVTNRNGLNNHRRLFHEGVAPKRCTVCQQAFPNAKYCQFHMENDHGIEKEGDHLCNECGKFFNTKNNLWKHIQDMHGRELHACNVCGKKCKSESSMRKHRKVVHFTPADIKCSTCGKLFKTLSHLHKHQKIHTKPKHICEICGREISSRPDNIKTHMLQHDINPYKLHCNYCKKKFKFVALLQRHLEEHASDVPHMCPFCKRSYPTKQSLDIHVTVHGEKIY